MFSKYILFVYFEYYKFPSEDFLTASFVFCDIFTILF